MTLGKLDSILEVAPEATAAHAVEVAASILNAEAIAASDASNTASITASPAANTSITLTASEKPQDPHNTDLKSDTDFARENIKDVIEQGRLALNGIIELAEAGDTPRAYEVVATVLSAIVSANRELINIHKVKKDATRETVTNGVSSASGAINIGTAVFNGNTNDLLREIKAVRKQAEAAAKEEALKNATPVDIIDAEVCSSDAQPLALENDNGEKS